MESLIGELEDILEGLYGLVDHLDLDLPVQDTEKHCKHNTWMLFYRTKLK